MTNSTLRFKPAVAEAVLYVSGRSAELVQAQYGLEEVIKLASNESPLPPPAVVLEAIRTAAATLNRYPVTMGDEHLREVLAGAVGQGLTPDNFVTGNGGCDVLALIALGFLDPGDECIISRPTFPIYEATARRAGAGVVCVDLDPDHFTYDVEAILAAITERTRLIYVCSPNNPTGTIITAEQMETLVNHLPPHVLLVSDEVYHHFADSPDYPDTLEYVRQGKNVAVLHSFSKVFGLAGLRLGYAVAPPEIAAYLARARQPFHLSKLTTAAAEAALQEQSYLDEVTELTITGRAWLAGQLGQLGLPVWPSQANFVLFKPPVAPQTLSDQLERRGVIVRPLTGFYLPDYLRVTVGLPEENERFIEALREVLAKFG